MLVEITQDEYNNLTVDELLEKYPYVNGTKSTLNTRLRSVGKNIYNGEYYDGYLWANGDTLTANANWQCTPRIRVLPNTEYTISVKNDINLVIEGQDENYNATGQLLASSTITTSGTQFTTSSNTKYIVINHEKIATGTFSDNLIQIEEGSSATTLEEYKESTTYIDEEIRSLPNGVKDEINVTVQSFENGTLYVEQTVRDSGIYSGGLSVSNANLPIDSLEAVYKVKGDTKTPVDLSNCTVATDGLSFTITGATDGEKYEFIYSYPSELGTIPEIEYSVPLNRSAQIDGNTNMINQLSKELGDLWTTLLPLADKELAMAGIATITTDMSADVNDNELKNKINEILNVWV
jgi:hypothetical protein